MSWNNEPGKLTATLFLTAYTLLSKTLDIGMPWNLLKRPLSKKPTLEPIDEDSQLFCTILCPFDQNWWIMANSWEVDSWGGNASTTVDNNDQWNEGGANNGADAFNDDSATNGFGGDDQGAATVGGGTGGCFNCGEGNALSCRSQLQWLTHLNRRSYEGRVS